MARDAYFEQFGLSYHKGQYGTWLYVKYLGWELFPVNNYENTNYPREADRYAVERMIYIDNGDDTHNSEFYYGYKECMKLGIPYKPAPIPEISDED